MHTLMAYLKDGPKDFRSLLALERGVLCILHLIRKLEKGIFDIVEAVWRRFSIPCGANRRHLVERLQTVCYRLPLFWKAILVVVNTSIELVSNEDVHESLRGLSKPISLSA